MPAKSRPESDLAVIDEPVKTLPINGLRGDDTVNIGVQSQSGRSDVAVFGRVQRDLKQIVFGSEHADVAALNWSARCMSSSALGSWSGRIHLPATGRH